MIQIKNYRRIDKNGLIAIFDVYMNDAYGTEINGLKLSMSKMGKKFIAFPSKEYISKEGERKFSSYIYMKEYEKFTHEIEAAIDEYLKNEQKHGQNRFSTPNQYDQYPQYKKPNSGQNRGDFSDSEFAAPF